MATSRDVPVDEAGARSLRSGTRMTDIEAVMWHVEGDPLLSSTFGSVTVLDRRPDAERLRRRMARMARVIPRLHQRVVDAPVRLVPPLWQDDPDFDIDYHVRHVALPEPGDRRQLFDLALRFVQDPLDRRRPLWQYLIVDGVDGTGGALVQKTHHTVTDGVGGVRMSEQFVDLTRDAPEPEPDGDRRPEPTPTDRQAPWEWTALTRPMGQMLGMAQRLAAGAAGDLRHPSRAVALPGEVLEATRSTLRQLLVTDPARSPLWTDRSLQRSFEVFDVDFDDAHRAAKALGGSLNDFFVTGAAGAAGAYHRHVGADVADLRVAMPVSTRRDRSAGGNAFVPTRLLVPAGETDPATRFAAVHDVLSAAKRERAIGLADAFASLAVLLPTPVLSWATRRQVETIDFATSNVRAAPFDLFIAGARIEANYAIGPLGGTAFNLTMMSYSGTLNMGLHTDRGAVADPGLLRDLLVESFAELIATAR